MMGEIQPVLKLKMIMNELEDQFLNQTHEILSVEMESSFQAWINLSIEMMTTLKMEMDVIRTVKLSLDGSELEALSHHQAHEKLSELLRDVLSESLAQALND